MLRFVVGLLLSLPALAAPPAVVWDVADHGGDMVASGQALVRNPPFGSPWETARTHTSQSTGVRTVQIAVDAMGTCNNLMVGVANGTTGVGTSLGANANSIGYWSNGNTYFNGTWGGVMPGPFTAGDVLGVQVDFTAHTVRFQRNAGAWSATLSTASLGPDVFVAASLCMYGSNLTANGVHIVSDDWNDFPEPTVSIEVAGDSMSLTSGVLRVWHKRLADALLSGRTAWARVQSFAMNGASWDYAWPASGYPYSLTQDAPLRVDPARSTLPNWLVLFAGTNGIAIAHHDGNYEFARLKDYVNARIAAGWNPAQIIVCTMLPRTGVSETTRALYNANIVNGAAILGYRVARLDLDPNIGATVNATYFQSDGIHPNDAGHQIIARIVQGAMI